VESSESLADESPQIAQPSQLPAGQPLSATQASEVLREIHAPIVMLAGAAKAGKTTLIASIHDAFQRGPFAGYLASGSHTLMGFEERCFDSRYRSGAKEPATIRTRALEGSLYYHLKVREKDLQSPARQILFLDMSGEHYERMTDSESEARRLAPLVHRADHFVYLVNGARLASLKFRSHTVSNASMLMRRLFESGLLDSSARVDVLLTKWDLVQLAGPEIVREALSVADSLFPEKERARVARFRITPVAARPHFLSSLTPGYGLQELLRSWVEDLPKKLLIHSRTHSDERSGRLFDRFALLV